MVSCGSPGRQDGAGGSCKWQPAPFSLSASWLGQGAWRHIPGLRDFSLSPMPSPLQDGSHFSGFPHTSTPGTFWTQEASGGWRGWGLECSESHKGTAGSLLLLLHPGSPWFRCPPGALSPLRAGISATRWHCDPAEWLWMPEWMVSGESSPPPPSQHNNLCMACVPLAPTTTACCPEHPRPDSCFSLTTWVHSSGPVCQSMPSG